MTSGAQMPWSSGISAFIDGGELPRMNCRKLALGDPMADGDLAAVGDPAGLGAVGNGEGPEVQLMRSVEYFIPPPVEYM